MFIRAKTLAFAVFVTAMICAGKIYAQHANMYVLELFTSQSCSSCPAADKLLQTLERDNVITLSCNVTYWNHLHWEDTLSQDVCTQRQRRYSLARGDKGRVFTPELMINGKKSIVGSNKSAVANYLEDTQHSVHSLEISHHNDNIHIKPVPELANAHYSVVLVEYGPLHTQHILSGENRGKTIQYSNPVTSFELLAQDWDNNSELTVPFNQINASSRYAVMIVNNNTQHIHAATRL